MSISLDSGSLEAVVGSLEVAVVGSGSETVVGSSSLEAVVAVVAFVGSGSLEAAFAASAVAVAAKTAVAAQASNSLKMAVALVQEPKWVVAFATVQAVSGSEPDSHDASLPPKWKPNYSLDRD
jgi:hypothetical protein